MKNRLNYILYPLIWMFLMFISLFLKPHSDDYEFLYYFTLLSRLEIIGPEKAWI